MKLFFKIDDFEQKTINDGFLLKIICSQNLPPLVWGGATDVKAEGRKWES